MGDYYSKDQFAYPQVPGYQGPPAAPKAVGPVSLSPSIKSAVRQQKQPPQQPVRGTTVTRGGKTSVRRPHLRKR